MAWTGLLFVMGVKGETEKVGFDKQIDVLACSMGVHNNAQLDTKGWSSGRATATEFNFTLMGGSAAIQMENLSAIGKTIDRVTLTEVKTIGDKELTPYKITDFLDCKITAVSESSSEHGDTTNNVSIAYGEKKVAYSEQKTKGGAVSNAANYHYDFKLSQDKS